MRILCAPDSFKETLTAQEAACALAEGAQRAGVDVTVDICPIADGGEGTLESLVSATGGTLHEQQVAGPLGSDHPVMARYGIDGAGTLGIVELAQASGLALLAMDARDPMHTTTYGTGELVRAAMDRGCQSIIIGLGGSATVDGGAGLAQALGIRFYDQHDQLITQPITGGMLQVISRVEPSHLLPHPEIQVACDVTNPLCGKQGAAAVYGPQKGATPEQVQQLDHGLCHLAKLVSANPDTPGYGAAGGSAFGLVHFCDAELSRGVELVLDAVRFDQRCRNADLVLTGEGCLDAQTLQGKACFGVAQCAQKHRVPTIALAGSVSDDLKENDKNALKQHFSQWHSLSDRFGRERAWNDTAAALAELTQEIVDQRKP